ncbi:unnamed protein product [Closterium sp. NIES-65]|nr:unnamed protein product [Closterium sp. NIES-65]
MGVRHCVSHRGSHHLAVAPQRVAKIAAMGLVISCLQRVLALLLANPPEVGEPSAHRERDPPISALRGDLRRGGGGGGGRLGAVGILCAASSPHRDRTRQGLVAVGVGGMVRAVAQAVAGKMLQSPFSVGQAPGRVTAFPRAAPIVPLPTRAGRDPMLTMCRMLNLAEACEVVASLQMAILRLLSCHQERSAEGGEASALWDVFHLPLEPEDPLLDDGPGAAAFRMVATVVEESPLGIVPALACVLRWLGRQVERM